jgi:hypothetical protein
VDAVRVAALLPLEYLARDLEKGVDAVRVAALLRSSA